jgi:hypothetical protein
MVRKGRVGVKSVTVKSDTNISKIFGKKGLRCIGEVCFTDDGKIRIDLRKSKCPKEVIDKLVKGCLKGVQTEYLLGKEGEEELKEVKSE